VLSVVRRTSARLAAIQNRVAVWDGGFDRCVSIVEVLGAAPAADPNPLERHFEHRLVPGLRLLQITGGVRLAEPVLDPLGPIGPALVTLVVNPFEEPQPDTPSPRLTFERTKQLRT
jgi:hypothetical protein